ncbi:hypothetical protein A7985_06490 [Pseudoalteromonas luteoviolacea]|uniref:Uncharacterized protein n=2 Tax=Pseudoalteromonas luteoviolacea TaxID=43657 RepID=A0A1C0TW87_9GAMM|nr:hypothetical protein A7985_06490 [Pseudoalteromonas luteoviolacea]
MLYFEVSLNPSIDYFLWVFPCVILMILMAIVPLYVGFKEPVFKTWQRKGMIGLSVFCIIGITNTYSAYKEDIALLQRIGKADYEVVSGCIERYRHHQAGRGHKTEFEINGVAFKYSHATPEPFFHGSENDRKVIKNGNCMEIGYFNDDMTNKIIKIVLNDSNKEPK